MITALICLNKEAAFGLGIPIGGALSLITMMVSGGRALEMRTSATSKFQLSNRCFLPHLELPLNQ